MYFMTMVLWCDDMHYNKDCMQRTTALSKADARKLGWGFSKKGGKCYCPKCAPKHKSVGRNGFQREKPFIK